MLSSALYVSSASAAEAADAQSTSTEDIQPSTDTRPNGLDQQPNTDTQPGATDAQPGTDAQQPSADQQPNPEAQPTGEDQPIAAGDRIRPDAVSPLGGCSAGVPATDGENNFIITAGHCNSGLGSVGEENSSLNGTDPGWFSEDGQPVGHTERRGGQGADFSVVRTETDLDPEDFTKVGEAHVGEEVCARGATSFAATQEDQCGTVTDVGKPYTFHNEDGTQPTVDDLIDTDVNTLGGDSGGLLYDENTHQALGVLSGGGRFYPLSKVLEQNPDLHLGVAPKSGL
ncbi:S1 family peptidase [Streptomyces sp. NRAIS4]